MLKFPGRFFGKNRPEFYINQLKIKHLTNFTHLTGNQAVG